MGAGRLGEPKILGVGAPRAGPVEMSSVVGAWARLSTHVAMPFQTRLRMKPHQALQVAVVIQRVAQPNQWENWQFRLLEVVPDEGAFGPEPRRLHDDGKTSRWLYPRQTVELFPDECKGYFLNLTSGRPVWFVSWLVDEADASMVKLTGVGVSYIEADRRMTAEECVENVPLDDELCEWLRVFTNTHFRPDTGRKVRAMSFLSPAERELQNVRPDPADGSGG